MANREHRPTPARPGQATRRIIALTALGIATAEGIATHQLFGQPNLLSNPNVTAAPLSPNQLGNTISNQSEGQQVEGFIGNSSQFGETDPNKLAQDIEQSGPGVFIVEFQNSDTGLVFYKTADGRIFEIQSTDPQVMLQMSNDHTGITEWRNDPVNGLEQVQTFTVAEIEDGAFANVQGVQQTPMADQAAIANAIQQFDQSLTTPPQA